MGSRSGSQIKNLISRSSNLPDRRNYGQWCVIAHHDQRRWWCRCSCGYEAAVSKSHLRGGLSTKCKQCQTQSVASFLRHKDFPKLAREVHGDRYDYSKVVYHNNRKLVIIVCPHHGQFTQTPKNHLKGHGCPRCGSSLLSLNDFITQSQKKHDNRYGYDLVNYTTGDVPVSIICPVHGPYSQVPYDHMRGAGCKACVLDTRRLTTIDFVTRAAERHNGRYDYSKTVYCSSSLDPVCVICRQHGEFWQRPDAHLYAGHGCPQCPTVISTPHQTLIDLVPDGTRIELNNRTAMAPLEIDVWFPDHSFGCEVHGAYWHGVRTGLNDEERRRLRRKHVRKAQAAQECNILLYQFWEYEIVNKPWLVRSMIRHAIGKSEQIPARKCKMDSNVAEIKSFFDVSHMAGHRPASVNYALRYDGGIVCAISFMRHPQHEWEIARFACAPGKAVVGGFSRLLTAFIREHKPQQIMTFADRRFSVGNVYAVNGFELVRSTKPNYCYYKGGIILSRQQCQKHKLARLLGDGFNPNQTESENMLAAKYTQLFDAGHLKFVWVS